LAIDAFAKAAVAFQSAEYLKAAIDCAEFIWTTLRESDGRLLHVYRAGRAKQPAFLDDYAFMIVAWIELYQASWDARWLDRARTITEQMVNDFWDSDASGFFYTAAHATTPIARWKERHDSSLPSGNATAALALLRMGLICQNERWLDLGRQAVSGGLSSVKLAPMASAQMMIAINTLLDQRRLIEVVAPHYDETAKARVDAFRRLWAPHLEFRIRFVDAGSDDVRRDSPEHKPLVQGRETAYICEGLVCHAPVVGWDAIEPELKSLIASPQMLS
jgi:uncharacterized protein YyaL (SSP411 family)